MWFIILWSITHLFCAESFMRLKESVRKSGVTLQIVRS